MASAALLVEFSALARSLVARSHKGSPYVRQKHVFHDGDVNHVNYTQLEMVVVVVCR